MNRSRHRWTLAAIATLLIAIASVIAVNDRRDQSSLTLAVPEATRTGEAAETAEAPVSSASPSRALLMTDWDTQVAHVPALRRLADAGVASAAWRMTDFVARCARRTPETEAETRRRLEKMRREREEDDRGVSPDDWADVVEMITKSARQDRQMCADLEHSDRNRLLAWLEFALAGDEDELFMRMTMGGFVFPDDQAWLIRNAERLAVFVERAKTAFDARIEAGDIALLHRAAFYFRNNPEFWPRGGDFYRAHVHETAAALLHDDGSGLPSGRDIDSRYLTPAQMDAAAAEGRALYDRCCAGR